jgi:leucyl/phenylalanyl-tRNA--protein transferase
MDVTVGEPSDFSEEHAYKVIGWWSPDPRGILPLTNIKISQSLRKSCRRYSVTFDLAFEAVMKGCQAAHPDAWITPKYLRAYTELHHLGHAHSIEVRDKTGELVGGLYGVEIGGLFAAESMFHTARDASKVAIVALVDVLSKADSVGRVLDVQWRTDHLASLGVVAIPRAEYLDKLSKALKLKAAFG